MIAIYVAVIDNSARHLLFHNFHELSVVIGALLTSAG